MVEHFFRHESGKLTSVLTRIFGSNNLLHVEDIVQDALAEAISNWTYNGIPENHIGWLYTVAKNKALNVLNRDKYCQQYVSESLGSTKKNAELNLIDSFSEDSISDDQLRMMFMCCHPSISEDSQIALVLRTLCGFSISEIAKAFLTNNENINKRLVRARKTIRLNRISFIIPPIQILDKRVNAVLEAIYLLFNEGYSASKGDDIIREELCRESIRLADIIVNHKFIANKSNPLALLALMQLNASRFKARQDEQGNILTLSEQDRKLWDYHIMEQGFSNLKRASENQPVSKYHILAAISSFHCSAKNFESTDWNSILRLYEQLLTIDNSAIVILNHAIALSKIGETKEALEKLYSIENQLAIKSYYLFHSTKAEFEIQLNQKNMAKETLEKAIEIAPLSKEKNLLKIRYAKYFGTKSDNDVPIS